MSQPQLTRQPSGTERRHYRYYGYIMVGFVTVLLCSNLIGPGKVCQIRIPWTEIRLDFGAGNIFFPIGYIFGDILTEVYGYALARRVIWSGFAALFFAIIMSIVVIGLPLSPDEPWNETIQPALEVVFGGTWRIGLASLIAYWCGDFANSYVLAKMKVKTAGRWLWTRTIGSTIVGQGIDSLIFYPLAFYSVWSTDQLWETMLFNWGFKVGVEVLLTPVTYAIVNALKRAEQEDYYDTATNFTPFSLAE